MKKLRYLCLLLAVLLLSGCGAGSGDQPGYAPPESERLVVYTSHKEELWRPIVREFEERTGIWVDVVTGGSNELLERIASEADAPVVAFELDVDALVKASRPARDYVDVPTFPAVSMDVAFVVDEAVTCEKIMQCMTSAGGKLLEDARLFDVYRDEERVGAGKKSMAFALTYRAPDRTLTSEEVDKAHDRLVKKVAGATGAEVRG